MPVTIMRWAATVPFSMTPAAMEDVSRATATSPAEVTSSMGRPMASAVRRSDGPKEIAP